jgi:glycosyltransferase involved in cell wall biosynthesis
MEFIADHPLQVDIVIPVYNEEKILPRSVGTLIAFLRDHVPLRYRVLITDNASTDLTEKVSRELAEEYPEVEYVRLPVKGRGGALKTVWLASPADYVTYMDVDLSTNLTAFPRMLELLEDDCDVVLGTRLSPDADTTRSLKRGVLSRGYNLLVKLFFGTHFTDAQCGFKGVRQATVRHLVPHVEDRKWFFDTELLVLAEKSGYRLGEVPVDWIEDLDTRVQLLRTVWDDLMALFRLRRGLSAVLRSLDEGNRPDA